MMSDKMIRWKPVKQTPVVTTRLASLSDSFASESATFPPTPKRLKNLPKHSEIRRKYETDLKLLDSIGELLIEGRGDDSIKVAVEDFHIEGLRTNAFYKILPFIAKNKSLLKWLSQASTDEVDRVIAKVQRASGGMGNSAISVFAQVKAFADEVAKRSGKSAITKQREGATHPSTRKAYKILVETGCSQEEAIDATMPKQTMSARERQIVRRNLRRRLKNYVLKKNMYG